MSSWRTCATSGGVLFFALYLVFLAGCSCRHCDQERERTVLERGEPLDREVERDGTLFTEAWYYWQDDLTVIFFWDERDCSCEMSIYEIGGAGANARLEELADPNDRSDNPQPWVLKERRFSTSRNRPFAP